MKAGRTDASRTRKWEKAWPKKPRKESKFSHVNDSFPWKMCLENAHTPTSATLQAKDERNVVKKIERKRDEDSQCEARTWEDVKTMASRTEEWPCKTRVSQTVHRNSRLQNATISLPRARRAQPSSSSGTRAQKSCTRDCYLSFAYRWLFYTSLVSYIRDPVVPTGCIHFNECRARSSQWPSSSRRSRQILHHGPAQCIRYKAKHLSF